METQLAMLDLLKFSYCKSGEAAAWDISAEIFPHIQFAINFIEKALKNKDKGRCVGCVLNVVFVKDFFLGNQSSHD